MTSQTSNPTQQEQARIKADRGTYYAYLEETGEQKQQMTFIRYSPKAQHIGPNATLPEVTAVLEKLVADESNVFYQNPGCISETRGYGDIDALFILRNPNVLVREKSHYSPDEEDSEKRIIDFRRYTVFGTSEEIEKFDALVQAKDRELLRIFEWK